MIPTLSLILVFLGAPDGYRAQPFEIDPSIQRVAPADLDGDGKRDLILARPGRLEVFLQSATGFQLTEPSAVLPLPGRSVGWDLVDVDESGAARILALVDGQEVRAWRFVPGERRFEEPVVLARELGAVVPGGFYHISFARDVDGDGDLDLVIPRNGFFQLHIHGPEGYTLGPSVVSQVSLHQDLDTGGDLKSRIGQTLRLPLFEVKDMNGDGRVDVRSETDDRLEVYLADESGSYPRTPTYAFDIAAERDRLGPIHAEDFDTSNILAPASRTVQLTTDDVNGDGAIDLIFRSGTRVDLYLATSAGIDTTDITQRVKASGNVVAAATDDDDGDGIADLWIFRVETVSLGKAMWWLLASGSLDIDVLIYRFEKNRFAKRPGRRIRLTITFPALLGFVEDLQEIGVDVRKKLNLPAATGDLTGSGEDQDILTVQNATLRGYLGKAPDGDNSFPRGAQFLKDILRIDLRDGSDEYTIALDELADLIPSPEARLIEAIDGSAPDLTVSLPEVGESPTLIVLDLDGDLRDDLLIFSDRDDEKISGFILLSSAAPETSPGNR